MFWVGVLGPLLVRSGGEPVPVPAPKQRVILATLALRAGQVASYDELEEIVWDGAPPAGARVAIRNYVKRLRQILGPVAGCRIVTRDPGYALEAEPDEVDALRFTALCGKGGEAIRHDAPPGSGPGAWELLGEAIGLWRGNPLVDVPSNVLITAEVPRLDALRMQAQEWRMDAGLARGLHAELVGELTQLAHDHPWRERFHAQLMLALYRCGRQAEALAAYQRTRRMLVDELGVEPGRELRDLQAGILDADPDLAAPGPALARFLTAPPAASPAPGGPKGTAGQAPAARPGQSPASQSPASRTAADQTSTSRAPAGRAPASRAKSGPAGDGPGRPVAGGANQDSQAARAAEAKVTPTVGGGASRPGRTAAAPAGQATVVPRQLPAGVAHFAGRTAELAELQSWRHDASLADGVESPGHRGNGRGRQDRAGGALGPSERRPVPRRPALREPARVRPVRRAGHPGDALRFLGALGVPAEQMPASVEAQAALYRSLLAGRGAGHARQRPRRRPGEAAAARQPACLVLVTSRRG